MSSEDQSMDPIETMMLMAMDCNHRHERQVYMDGDKNDEGIQRINSDIGSMARIPDRSPTRSFTFDATDKDRLFTDDIDLLLHHPADIIGSGKEIIMLDETELKWSRIEPVQRPKGLMTVGTVAHWYAIHYKNLGISGDSDYVIDVFPMNRKGHPMPTGYQGWKKNDPEADRMEQAEKVAILCSVIEDAMRPGAILAEASVDSSIVFPIHEGAQKDFFSLRYGPRQTPTGRKNPILHFCQKHIRSKPGNDDTVEVSEHWKGTETLQIDDMSIQLYPAEQGRA